MASVDQPDQVVRPSAGVPGTAHRRRRPTGAAPPLPKQIGSTGWIWLILLLAVVVTGCLWLRADPGPLDRFDAWITDAVASIRTGWLDAIARQAHTIGSRVGFAALGVLLVVATAWFRRWRHLVIWMISLGIAGALLQGLELVSLRPRPFGVRQLASWEGYATPSIPIGAIAILSIGVAYMLVVPGRPRYWAKLATAGAIAIDGPAADLPRCRPLHRRRRSARSSGSRSRWPRSGRSPPTTSSPITYGAQRQGGAPRRHRTTRRGDPRRAPGAARASRCTTSSRSGSRAPAARPR